MREIYLIDKVKYAEEYAKYTDGKNITYNKAEMVDLKTSLTKFVFTSEDLVENYNNEMVESVVTRYINLFTERGLTATEPQINFARETSKILLGELKKQELLPTIPAPCGFGKSTINQVFLEVICLAYKEGIFEDGIIIVTDKIDQLYELHNDLIETVGYYINNSLKNKSENTPYTYVMEGWKEDSYERGVCLNRDAKVYEYGMCTSERCPNYGKCKICNQKFDQFGSPILLMTNARLETCGEGINFYSTYTDKSKNRQRRTLRIIDEKPTMRNNFKVNIEVLGEIRNALDKIDDSKDKKTPTDKQILIDKWEKIRSNINGKFTDFSKSERIIVSNINNTPILLTDIEFTTLWENYMGKNKFKRELEHIHTVLTKGGLFINANKRGSWIETIGMKNIHSENFKTVIYDGTALIDPDYSDESIIRFLDIENLRTFENMTVNVHMGTKLTKTNFNAKNHLEKGCAKFLDAIKKEDTYVVTHKKQASLILAEIRKHNKTLTVNLPKDAKTFGAKRPNIVTFSDIKLPYYGNTKGSNVARDCTQMVNFGWNVLPDYEYLIRYLCNSNDEESLDKLFKDCANIETSKNIINYIIESNSKLKLYKNYCMLVDFVQEVFRTALRKYDCNDDITIECFQCDMVLVRMIEQIFPNCNVNVDYDGLECFAESKIEGFTTKDGNMTAPQKFIEWSKNWNGEKISVTDLKSQCNVSDNQWKDLKKKKDIKIMLGKLNNTKEGRVYYYSKYLIGVTKPYSI
ncbi:MAG: hypothetical protein ACI8WT_001798 [Clostridium sp.]|jgi:hypothetical protein